jgi:cephalosporin-C deacetylase
VKRYHPRNIQLSHKEQIMPFFDLSLEQLYEYKPARSEPADFDAFWQRTLNEARQHPLNAQFTPVDYGLSMLETYDVTFSGFGGHPVKGWFLRPKEQTAPLPCVVEYIGYGGGRNFPTNWLLWPSTGYAHLVMDTRGQGSAWSPGDTPDLGGVYDPHIPGFMTLGIRSPETYYYRRVYTDAVRAVEAAQSHPGVDASRIAVTGGSQGGGITIAASGLMPDVAVSMPDVPFLCHFRTAVGKTDSFPYQEIVKYLSIHRDQAETAFSTLDYFDGVNFAARTKARSLYSAGLMDQICPPSTVFAAYNHVPAPKDINVYWYNEHEGGGPHHSVEKVKFVKALWA